MKTQNNNQETSKSQVSKSTLVASAVLFGAVLINLSVNAQDLWKEFSNSASYGKMALVMDGQLNETENADAAFKAINAEVANQLYYSHEMFISETEAEETMEVESWMVEEAKFTSTVDFNAVETEESMEVESWMTDANLFTNADMETTGYAEKIALEAETEDALALEPWMMNESLFTNDEEALAIESWMTTEEYFNSPEVLASEESLKVEEWMLEAENFTNHYSPVQYAVK